MEIFLQDFLSGGITLYLSWRFLLEDVGNFSWRFFSQEGVAERLNRATIARRGSNNCAGENILHQFLHNLPRKKSASHVLCKLELRQLVAKVFGNFASKTVSNFAPTGKETIFDDSHRHTKYF